MNKNLSPGGAGFKRYLLYTQPYLFGCGVVLR
jgi:hypothetical protein